jgi:hypothetical protein
VLQQQEAVEEEVLEVEEAVEYLVLTYTWLVFC